MVALFFFLYPHEFNFLFSLLWVGFLFLVGFSMGGTLRTFLFLDSFSFFLVLLAVLVFFSSILSVLYEKFRYSHWGYLNFLLFFLLFFLFYLFFSCNMFLFYVFFELTVIPTFIIIIGWGYRVNRIQASCYMVIYMLLSSFPLLLSILFSNDSGLSFSFFFNFFIKSHSLGSFWWFLFFLVFSVKLPLFFLHLWLPKAHVDAPLLGSMVLAGVLLKMGGFGVYRIRFLYFLFYFEYGWLLACLSLVGSFYSAIVCLRQVDIKSLVAYSSIVHMGPVLSCFFLLSYYRIMGSYLVIFSHGLCSCALFFLLTFIRKNFFRRRVFLLRGSIVLGGVFSFFWVVFCFFNMAAPPSFNFFSELISIFSCLLYGRGFFFIFFLLSVFVGFYCVIIMVSVMHGFLVRHNFLAPFSIKLSDLLSAFFLLFFLFFFVFFSFIFYC